MTGQLAARGYLNFGAALPIPDRGWVVALIVVGAVLQLAGVATIVIEVQRGRREAAELAPDIMKFSSGATVPADEQMVPLLADQLARQLVPMVRRLVQPSRIRILGVALVAVGIVLEAVAAVWALYLGPAISTQVIT